LKYYTCFSNSWFDITNKTSFDELKEYWYNQVKQNKDDKTILAVVANKRDLYENPEVTDEEGKAYAQSIGAIFQATSAKSDYGITTLFDNIGQKYFNPDFDCSSSDKKMQEEYAK